MIRRLAFLFFVLLVSLCRGQADSAGADADEGAHGWLVSRALFGGGVSVLHVPPRSSAYGAGASTGVAMVQRTLNTMPSGVATWGRKAYFLYQSDDRIDVFSLHAAPDGLSGYWQVEPRLAAAAELSLTAAGGTLESVAGTPGGLLVLTGGESWRLWRLSGGAWSELRLPERLLSAEAGRLRLVEGARRVTLVLLGEATEEHVLFEDGIWRSWRHRVEFEPGSTTRFFAWEDDVCALTWREGVGLEGWLVKGDGLRLFHDPSPVRPSAVTVMERGHRIAALRSLRNDEAEGRNEPIARWELTEHSVATGRELYRGAPRAGEWVAPDLRVFSLGMIAMVLGVLFYLLQPAVRQREIALPEGFALAPPSSRVMSGIFDAALVAFVVGLVTDTPVLEILLVVPLLESEAGVFVLIGFIASGIGYGTVAEWAFGRTLGKVFGASRVVSVEVGRARPGLLRLGARNAFRWAFVPWAVLGMTSPDFRHRGDRVAGTAVVVPTGSGGPSNRDDAGG